MNILKRIFSKRVHRATWDDITLQKFNQLALLGEKADPLDVIDIVYSINSREIPYNELKKYPVSFLSEPCPRRPIQKQYTLNGNLYNACFDITKITTAQFVDFRNYSNSEHPTMENLLTVCLIPDGHTYNDGYDIEQVKADVQYMPITDAQTIAFFLVNQLAVLLQGIQCSLLNNLKTDPQTKQIQEMLAQVDLPSLIYYHS